MEIVEHLLRPPRMLLPARAVIREKVELDPSLSSWPV